MTGASLTATTVKLKLREPVNDPSVTVTVRSALPNAFKTGETLAKQLGQVPVNATAPVEETMEELFDV